MVRQADRAGCYLITEDAEHRHARLAEAGLSVTPMVDQSWEQAAFDLVHDRADLVDVLAGGSRSQSRVARQLHAGLARVRLAASDLDDGHVVEVGHSTTRRVEGMSMRRSRR